MPRIRKTRDEYRLHVNYGEGWEEVHATTTRADIRKSAKEYRENAPQYPVKWTGPHRVRIAEGKREGSP